MRVNERVNLRFLYRKTKNKETKKRRKNSREGNEIRKIFRENSTYKLNLCLNY